MTRFAIIAAFLVSIVSLSSAPALSAETNSRIDPAFEACLQDLPICLAQNSSH